MIPLNNFARIPVWARATKFLPRPYGVLTLRLSIPLPFLHLAQIQNPPDNPP